MGPIWGRQDPGGPHVGPKNFAISMTLIYVSWKIAIAASLSVAEHQRTGCNDDYKKLLNINKVSAKTHNNPVQIQLTQQLEH